MSMEDGKKGARPAVDAAAVSRRTLMAAAGCSVALMGLGALKYAGTPAQLRPPGGQDEERLMAACIRCQKCFGACPRRIIVPAKLESGVLSVRTPVLSFDDSYCDWCAEENGGVPLCVSACPTEALHLPPEATAEKTIIGMAKIDRKTCLAFRDTGCRYCYDACPYDAIELRTDDGTNPRPYIIEDRCNGCGACESVCVSLTVGALASSASERAVVIRPIEKA